MAKHAVTYSVVFAAPAEYLAPTVTNGVVRIFNMDSANGVWIRVADDGLLASVDGDECVFIPAGRSHYARYQRSFNMIAVAANVKINMEDSQGRSW